LTVARLENANVVRFRDVWLVAAINQDDVAAASLREMYLAPLERERTNGRVARETLRAYIDTGLNVSSAAAVLNVNRHTVTYRLQSISERLEQPLHSCIAELHAALRLAEFDI
jgi:DNA-binding PucR family transcriptional regulator